MLNDDSLAPSGAPPSAIRSWTNGRDLFIEIPGKKGPYIQSVQFDHRGIAHLFTLHNLHRVDWEYSHALPSGYSNFVKGSAEDRAIIDRELVKMGLLK